MAPSDPSALLQAHTPDLSSYEELYKHLHQNPELSFCEQETAQLVADRLSKLDGYALTPHIGGHGLAAVLRNGPGPVVLLRADMDALAVEEQTGLPYASTKRMKDANGVEHPVMHACGHDMHVTCLLAAAEVLHHARSAWTGTLVLVFQPAEEKGKGAQAMLDAGLYTTHGIPTPAVVLGGHVGPQPTAQLSTRAGLLMCGADSFRITFHGRGAHASMPHASVDPVASAAHATVRLQSLVARELDPISLGGVVTVASIRAGTVENVIPATAEMLVDVRSSSSAMKQHLVDGVRRIVEAEARAAGMATMPEIEVLREFPVTYNDEEATAKLGAAMKRHFGDQWSDDSPIVGASEDFSLLASAVGRPSVFWWYGGADLATVQKYKDEGREREMPVNHSPFFAPVVQPTLRAGVEGYVVAALTWLEGK